MNTFQGTNTVPLRDETPATILYTADVIRCGVIHTKRIRILNLPEGGDFGRKPVNTPNGTEKGISPTKSR